MRLTRTGHKPKPGIVHLGPGAFFRAFNAVFTHEAMASAGGDWVIIAVSLRSAKARDDLAPQDGAFTSVTLDASGKTPQVVGSVVQVLVAPEDPSAVIAAMAAPDIQIVSLTITEKGYCHQAVSGRLDLAHPDIQADLANPQMPVSAPGYIVAALAERRAAGLPAFTVLSCDNLPANGTVVRNVILDFARALDADLADWIAASACFPSTMVDRITPATTPDDIAWLADAQGYADPACVMHEPFRQWVIEDNFAAARPAWDQAGAQFVRDVAAHEHMKLRCLNGTHSTLAYLGYLAGYETIAETVADPGFAQLCQRLWSDEILPSVPQPEGEDLNAYCAALLARYRNPAIRHRTWQIAMDGSQKLPQRLLGTIQDQLAKGDVPLGLCLAVAGWMRYVGGVDENGAAIDVRDPLAQRLKAACESVEDPEGKVAALLDIREIFDASLAGDTRFRGAVTAAYRELIINGAQASVGAYASGTLAKQ